MFAQPQVHLTGSVVSLQVVGVRSDKNAVQEFEQRYRQRLVKDTNDEMRNILAIKDLFGLLPGRETYVIGTDGKVCDLGEVTQLASSLLHA